MSKEPRAGREEILECQVMWEPDSKKNTQMDRFRAVVGAAYGLALENYDDLYHWSVESYSDFWAEFWKFSGIVFSHTYDEVVDTSKGIADVPEWFKGSRLNYAENLLQHGENDGVALYVAREGREEIKKVSFEELRRQVALYAAAMRKMGVRRGDRVIGYLPNSGHAVEAMLAATSIGAIWSSTSPDFGVNGVLDRFSQIQPKLIFSVEAVVYNGKEHDHIDKLQQVVKGLADLKKVVVIPYVSSREKIDISKIPNSVFLEDFLATGQGAQAPQLEFEQLPFSHPLFIMFSSGTTGAPKCMVHSAGGTLIQHLKEHILHGNMTSSDIILYYTTVGWMMWNWMVSALATGAAVVLYDGSPLVPTPNVLWDLVDRIGITILGTGAKWLSVLEEKDVKPVETHSLQTLHTILSTGSPLKAQSYDYVYRCIKSSVLLGSISGGTDIMSCFVGQNPSIPVYRGEIQARNLGMAVEVWNEEGKAVWGESGELVCTKPLPCQPTHFWNDENGSKYWKAYFSKFPVHPQRQESGNGREADHRWENRGAPQSLLEPRDPGFVPGRPRAAGLLSRAGTSLSHTRLSCHFCAFKELLRGTSLVAQWLRIRLPMQGTRVRALVWEDPTCRGATKPVRHNC
ncbi:acetoacetyl-CoA synthetase isoform X2 [Balaenoptera acutorostrata]|uniref:Acetoacetyl-CoA synthetase n=1 Tax=Balaenoptera acutorostrata TaxID=9767 RepID=A0ABM3RX00_BALAC|nr:acetoacetyl-CoA synthetase isoform X2 [Balaenoptera acutorostrata]